MGEDACRHRWDRLSGAVPSDVTQLLRQWSQGDSAALDELTPLIYRELHQRARNFLRRERPDHTLQPTALIHEVYLRLVGGDSPQHWQNRAHFFAIASRLMRQILVDHARRRMSAKRSGQVVSLAMEGDTIAAPGSLVDVVALDDALARLHSFDPRKSRVLEMYFFGGMKIEEIAVVLGLHSNTVSRDLRLARAWLQTQMGVPLETQVRPDGY